MKDRDHVVLTFDDESEFKKIVKTFVKRGIDCNQINVLFIYSYEEQKFLESLDKIPNINSLPVLDSTISEIRQSEKSLCN